jgi:hypothetical protein
MPHPLKRWDPAIRFAPNAVELRPTLAIAIARISADWAEIERALGDLLATILHTESRTGVAMYLALIGSAAQEAAISAAATKSRSGKFGFLIRGLSRGTRLCRGERVTQRR